MVTKRASTDGATVNSRRLRSAQSSKRTSTDGATVYSRRLRSAQSSNVCKCKVGSCPICNSRCKRCMCACDGVDPSEALKRSRGGYRRQVNRLAEERNENADKVNTRSTRKKSKKRKAQSHFHKVGLLESARKKPHQHQRAKKKQHIESDSSFHLSDNESVSSSTNAVDKNATKSTTIDESKVSEDHPETSSIPSDFELQIETKNDDDDSDIFYNALEDDISDINPLTTIAELVKKKRKEPTNSILNENKKQNPSANETTVLVPENSTTRKKTNLTRSEILENFLGNFDIPKYWLRVIPSFVVRENEADIESSTSKKSFGRLTSLCSKIVDNAIRTLCPGPGLPKFRKHLLKHMSKGFDHIKNLPYCRSQEEKLDTVIKTLCNWSNKSKKRSIERRVLRAVINESFLRHEIQSFKDNNGFKQGTGQAVQQAREDALELTRGNKLKLKVIKRQFRLDSTISQCVNFILSDDNVASVSWGTKKILLQSCGEILIPKLTRKSSIKDMYLRYKDVVSNDAETIKSATFYKICNVLTSSDQAMLNSINYVTCMLVNESCEVLQDIIDKAIENEHRDECTKYLTVSRNFLKNQFKNHIKIEDDECCFHGFTYALSRDQPIRENTNDNACKFPFFVCEHLKNRVRNNPCIESDREHVRNDALRVIDGIANKFKLFLGHQTRCQCQSVAISQIESEMKELCVRSRGATINAMIIIDFKMKYEIKSSRESTVEHYGKRGLGWHGMAVIFYLYDQLESTPYKNIIYIDQIMNDSNVQDSGTVIGLLEVGLRAIIKELPFIKEATLISDNASSYQNHMITFMVALYNRKFYGQLFISAIVHSETQYGKSLLDAHFATTNRHLINFMKSWKENCVTKINSPRGLAWALSFNKGVKNSMIQLVNFDREQLDQIQNILKAATGRCSEYYSRANYIAFKRLSSDEIERNGPFNSLGCVKAARLRWKVRAFSNVKPSVQFKVDMTSSDLVKVDNKTQSLILDILDRDYVNRREQQSSTPTSNKKTGGKKDLNKKQIEAFDSDSDYDDLPMKMIKKKNIVEESEDEHDFSFYRFSRKSKKNMVHKLESVGALEQIGAFKNLEGSQRGDDDSGVDDDDDSDYNEENDDGTINDYDDNDNVLDEYFLSSDDYRTYGDPSSDYFPLTESLTGTTVVKFQPLGAIRKKKEHSTKQSKISQRHMLKGVVEKAVIIARQSILTSDHFKNRNELDPIVNEANDFQMEPFRSGWARRGQRGNIYGESYVSLYEKELKEMFQMGVEYSYNKMSAGKMREHLQASHPDCFSIPGETEIKQFINKMSESMKRAQTTDPNKPKSNRGRKAGNTKVTWHAKLKEILERNLKEKPRVIYNEFIDSYNGRFPHDLPTKTDGDPDDTKIKQALQRFRRNIEMRVQKDVLM